MENGQHDVVAFQTLHAMYDGRNPCKPDTGVISEADVAKTEAIESEGFPAEKKPTIADQDTSLAQQLIEISEALKCRVGSDVDVYCEEVRNILLQIAPTHSGTQRLPDQPFQAGPGNQHDAEFLTQRDSTPNGVLGDDDAMEEESFLAEAIHQLMIETLSIEDALRDRGLAV